MTIRLNGSTSGYTEIDAPASAGNNTLVLPSGNGSNGQALITNGAGVLSFANAGLTQETAQNTTSGNTVGFTTIPSTAKLIVVTFQSVSTTGTAGAPQVRLGTSSGYVSTGYVTVGDNTSQTTGFPIGSNSANANSYSGVLLLFKLSGNLWVGSGSAQSTSNKNYALSGHVDVGGTVDRVALVSLSADTFDAGSINISYQS